MSLDTAQHTLCVPEIQDPFFTVTPELVKYQGSRYMLWPVEAEAVVNGLAWLGFKTMRLTDAHLVLYDADADKRLLRLFNLVTDIRWARIGGQVAVVETEPEVTHG